MLLEGKALEDFKKWVEKKEFIDNYANGLVVSDRIRLVQLENVFLFCLIVDWLEEVGLPVQIWKDEHEGGYYFWFKTGMSRTYTTRQESRDECVKYASKYYNENFSLEKNDEDLHK